METLIINKRHELPLRKKIIWDVVTIALWIGWFYLWKPLLVVIYKIITLTAEPGAIWKVIMSEVGVIPFHHALIMLITTPAILFLLSRIHRHQAPTEHLIFEPGDYAEYFALDGSKLKQCTESQLVTVYHDDHGHITGVEETIRLPHA